MNQYWKEESGIRKWTADIDYRLEQVERWLHDIIRSWLRVVVLEQGFHYNRQNAPKTLGETWEPCTKRMAVQPKRTPIPVAGGKGLGIPPHQSLFVLYPQDPHVAGMSYKGAFANEEALPLNRTKYGIFMHCVKRPISS